MSGKLTSRLKACSRGGGLRARGSYEVDIATGPYPITGQVATQTGNTVIRRIASTGPDLHTMHDLLWRGAPSGFVPFAVRPESGWRDIVSVPVTWLQSSKQPWLPYLLDKLQRDGAAGINPMYRAGVRTRQREVLRPAVIEGQHVEQLVTRTSRTFRKPGTGGLFYPHRCATDAAWLTACYVDCDGIKATMPTDGPGSVANVMRAYQGGQVPVPSFLVASGRGAWAFWQLVDERNPATGEAWIGVAGHGRWHRPDTACKSSRYALSLHHAVNSALVGRLRDIGADSCVDAAQSVRVFGSVNSKVDARVEVLPILVDGLMRAYTLAELAAWLKVPLFRGRPSKSVGQVASKRTEAQRRQGLAAMRARHMKVVDAVLRLGQLRGGFSVGHRNKALLYLALHGYLSGRPDADVAAIAQAEAQRCYGYGHTADFGPRQVGAILRNTKRKASQPHRPPKYATVIAALGITPAEQADIGLTCRPSSTRRVARVQTQDALIHAIRSRLGYTGTDAPSSRTMAAELTDAGFPVRHNAVADAYRRLGLASLRRGGRITQPQLPL